MINKLVGIFGLLFLVIGAVGYALWVEGITNVGIGNFISIPSLVIVVAFGGLTISYTWGWAGTAVDRGLFSSGAQKIYLYVGQSSGTNTTATNANLASGTQLRASGSYIAA